MLKGLSILSDLVMQKEILRDDEVLINVLLNSRMAQKHSTLLELNKELGS